MLLGACRAGASNEQPVAGEPSVGASREAALAGTRAGANLPATHARSHVLLGIDFSRPLKLPQCDRFYDSFDRPGQTCVYRRNRDHKPFKIEFRDGSVPGFLKWNNALVATDAQGRPDMLRFDVADAAALEDEAVDAMLETFGPPTSVENSVGRAKVGTWQHDDYVIRYFFDPNGGGIVQMETRKFHDASALQAAAGDDGHAKP